MTPGQERKQRRDALAQRVEAPLPAGVKETTGAQGERSFSGGTATRQPIAQMAHNVAGLPARAFQASRGLTNALGSLTVGPAMDASASLVALATGNNPMTRPGGIASNTARFNAAARDAQSQFFSGAGAGFQRLQKLGGAITGAQPLAVSGGLPTGIKETVGAQGERAFSGIATPRAPALANPAAAGNVTAAPQPKPMAASRSPNALTALPGGVVETTGAQGERAFAGGSAGVPSNPQQGGGGPTLTQRLTNFANESQQQRQLVSQLNAAESARINNQSLAEVGRQQRVTAAENQLRVARPGSRTARETAARLDSLRQPLPTGRAASDIATQAASQAQAGLAVAQAGQAEAATAAAGQETLAQQLNNQTAAENRQRLQQLATLGPDDPSRRNLIDALVAGAGRDPDADRFVAVDSIIDQGMNGPILGRQLYDTRTGTQVGGAPSQKVDPGSIPAGAIKALQQDPKRKAEFEKKYGEGSAAQYLN